MSAGLRQCKLPFNCLRLLAFTLLLALLSPGLHARSLRKKRPRPVRIAAPAPVSFTPSPELEARVQQEMDRARAALIQLEPATLLSNPYLVQAIYFSDGFLQNAASDRPDADPSLRVTALLCRMLTPARKAQFLQMLREVYADELATIPDKPLQAPVPIAELPRRGRRTAHIDAVDLFTDEGTAVVAASRGVVVLAQNGWTPEDPFSTSSVKGGNTIIVFDPATDRLYRYAHLEEVHVNPGTLVEAGQPLGKVGHTGWNAARPGHGRHLHFEINQHSAGSVRAISATELRDLLADVRPIQPAYGSDGME